MCSAHAADKIEEVAETCSGCHGANGVSENANIPSIGGQPESYLKKILLEWKSGVRHSETMESLIKEYSIEQIGALAAYYAKKPWTPVAQKTDANLVKLGEDATRGCAGCHGDTGVANDVETPNLNGQWAEYLEMDMLKFRKGSMTVSNPKMLKALKKLSTEELKAAAAFFASQGK
ncbi:MAG: c-type cytochrome [Thiobacillus sp.]|nr:c-type cytochrome [Thiobacillus sp.]